MLSQKIQTFLNQKLEETQLSKKNLADKTNITYSVIFDLTKGYKTNPELKTLQKIADTFNCSVDEVCGRDNIHYSSNTNFTHVSDEQAMLNLKAFITKKMSDQNITAHKLGRLAGSSTMAIASFVGKNPTKDSLGSIITVGVADYFKVSIDEMVGRTAASKDKTLYIPFELSESDVNIVRNLKKELSSLNKKSSGLPKEKSKNPIKQRENTR